MEDKKIEELKEQLLRMRAQEKDYTELQYIMSNLQQKYNLLNQQKIRLQADLAVRNEMAIRNMANLKAENDTLKEQLTHRQRDIQYLRTDYKKDKDLFCQKQIHWERIRRELQKLQHQNKRLKQDNQEMENQIRKLKEQRKTFYQKLDNLNRNIQDLQQQKRSKQKTNHQFEKQKRIFQKSISQLKNQLYHTKQGNNKLTLKNKQIESQLSSILSKQLSQQHHIQNMELCYSNLQQQYGQLRKALGQQIEANNSLLQSMKELQLQLQRKKKEHDQMTREYENQKKVMNIELKENINKQNNEAQKFLEKLMGSARQLDVGWGQIQMLMQKKKLLNQSNYRVQKQLKKSMEYLSDVLMNYT